MSVKGFHIFVCDDLGHGRAVPCRCKGISDISLLEYVADEVRKRSLNAEVSCAGSCNECPESFQGGPMMLVHPAGWWYCGLDRDKIDIILDALKENRAVDEYLVH